MTHGASDECRHLSGFLHLELAWRLGRPIDLQSQQSFSFSLLSGCLSLSLSLRHPPLFHSRSVCLTVCLSLSLSPSLSLSLFSLSFSLSLSLSVLVTFKGRRV